MYPLRAERRKKMKEFMLELERQRMLHNEVIPLVKALCDAAPADATLALLRAFPDGAKSSSDAAKVAVRRRVEEDSFPDRASFSAVSPCCATVQARS